MEKKEYLKLDYKDLKLTIYVNDFITFLGKGNEQIIKALMFNKNDRHILIEGITSTDIYLPKIKRNISYILNKDLDIFVAQTVEDEIAFGLEGLAKPKNEIREMIYIKAREYKLQELLKRSPSSLGSSDKAKLKILSTIIFEPKVLILENVLSELDNDDKVRIADLLNEYVNKGNIVLNFTSDIEETLYGNRIIVTDEKQLIVDGKTKSVLNEDKLMKKLGFGLPFGFELNKYLMDYGIIKRYELDMEKLVNKIWK